MFDPLELARMVNGEWMNEEIPHAINGFSFDTRNIETGNLFLALKGESRDGHDFLECAVKAGAVGAIVERFSREINLPQLKVRDVLAAFQEIARNHRENFRGKVVGITGSCGKTTTKDLISHLLGQEKTHSTYLNHNNLIGVPLTLVGLNSSKHDYGVIEAGINLVSEMRPLAEMIQPDISVVTNVYPVHLEGLGTVDNIAQEKSLLANGTKSEGCILFPSVCLQYDSFRSLLNRSKVLVYEGEDLGLKDEQLIVYRIEDNPDGTTTLFIKILEGDWNERFILPLLSKGILSNVALAIIVCVILGMEVEKIRERLATWAPSKHRGQIFFHEKQIYYADCYNANPVAMKDALEIFQRRFDSSYRRLYVLGCMGELGNDSSRYHYEVGAALNLSQNDLVLLLGVNSEDYKQGLLSVGNDISQIICLQNREKVFDYLKEYEGAIFLKGSKPYRLWEFLPSTI